MSFQNFTPVTTNYKTSTVTPELAAKTSRQSSDSSRLSFGAQVAKMCLYLHSTAVLRCDWHLEANISFPPGSGCDLPYCLSCLFTGRIRGKNSGRLELMDWR
jgi:hypothetical protein